MVFFMALSVLFTWGDDTGTPEFDCNNLTK